MKKLFAVLLLVAFHANAATVRINQYAFPSGSSLNTDLISYWGLSEAIGGTRVDSEPTGTPQDLTDVNTVDQTPGVLGNGALFISANSEVLIHADSADLSVGNIDFSCTAWVKFTTVATSQDIVSHYLSTGNQRAWAMRYSASAGRGQFIVSADGVSSVSLQNSAFGVIATNTWYFFFVSHDSVGNTIKMSIDDTAVVSLAHTTGVKDSTAEFRIGGNAFPTFFVDGIVDEVGFWKKALTPTEVSQLYNAGAPFSCCPFP